MKATYFVRMDTYWQHSRDTWFGPYPTRAAAETACNESAAGRADLGQAANDVRNQTRVLGIHNAGNSRKLGRQPANTLPALNALPGSTDALHTLREFLV